MKRNNLIKTIISLSLAIVMACSLSIAAFAAQRPDDTVSPLWNSISAMDVDMTFYENEGNASGTARKQSTAQSITGTLYLYYWNGSEYEYITEASNWRETPGTLAVSIDFEAESGVQYLAIWSVIAYTNDIGEENTIEYLLTCP